MPAFAFAWGSIVLAEPVDAGLLVGFGLILVSLALLLGIVLAARPLVLRRAAVWLRGSA